MNRLGFIKRLGAVSGLILFGRVLIPPGGRSSEIRPRRPFRILKSSYSKPDVMVELPPGEDGKVLVSSEGSIRWKTIEEIVEDGDLTPSQLAAGFYQSVKRRTL